MTTTARPAFLPAALLLGSVALGVLLAPGVGLRSVLGTLSGVLYGGVTEELLLRWGVMTLLGWLYWRRNLETGTLAHATRHVTVTLISRVA